MATPATGSGGQKSITQMGHTDSGKFGSSTSVKGKTRGGSEAKDLRINTKSS